MFRRSAVGGQRLLWRLVLCLTGTLVLSATAAGFQPLLAEDCVNGMDDDGDLLIDCDDPDCAAVDDDGDGVLLCAGDCDDRNASVWGAPSAIDDLMVTTAASDNLSWSAPAEPGGAVVVYDVLRSASAADLSGATCVELDETDGVATDVATPSLGDVLFFVVRVQNGCPLQSLGRDSSDADRVSGACDEDCAAAGDDDGDALADCADFDCIGYFGCPEDCADGFDNDGDGATDGDDPDCAAGCDLDGMRELANGEECDDGGMCAYDGCMEGSCDREDTIIIDSVGLAGASAGFDLDNADGDGNIHTRIDNLLGTNSLVLDQLNVVLSDSMNDGSFRQALTFGELDSLTDDPDMVLSLHVPIDPVCGIYDGVNPPPWITSPPAELYSDAGQFPGCVASGLVTDADDPANGIYPTSGPNQPPAPVLFTHADSLTLGRITLHRAYLEATVLNDGSAITGLANALAGGVVTAEDLWLFPGNGALCPTALHVVLGLIGQPDQDLDPAPGGPDSLSVASGFLPCLISSVSITSCIDGETGAAISNTALDGDCVLDPRIRDGYSSAFHLTAVELHIIESRPGTICP